ncbi:MAG: fimbrillin family protein [Prevotella sp.]|nr:fimbrillin family protein [Prevotella sp.]
MKRALYIGLTALLTACSADDTDLQQTEQPRGLRLTTSVNDFDGEDGSPVTRTDVAGTAFTDGDWMKLKIICPYSSHTEFCETTYGNTYDAMWLFKWQGTDWTALTAADKVDVGGNYRFTDSYNLLGRYEAQQTPYVYTASTWNENVIFLANGTRYSQYSYIFEADQTTLKNYVKSDLLWAQTYMQTGSYNVHLAFNHVMACLKISVAGAALSDKAVVTVEGMPDIDQREVVVGNYYAARSKVNSGYGYQQKHCCTKANNGKVLGAVYINEAANRAEVHPMSGNPVNEPTTVDFNNSFKTHPGNQFAEIPNTGTYTAYRDGATNDFYLIVPPCTLPAGKGVVWIRDGASRHSYELTTKTLEQGKRYTININLP